MSERETHHTLSGQVQVDDPCFGGELSGGKAGRGSENKVPFVAALSFDEEGHPLRIKLIPVSGFTKKKPLPSGLKPTLSQVVQCFPMACLVSLQ